MTILREKVLLLKRRYKYVTKDRFFYNTKAELKQKSSAILCWLLVESDNKGVMIFEFKFTRQVKLSYDQWRQLWTKRIATRNIEKNKKTHLRKKGFKSLYEILSDEILPNISIKYHDTWKFVDLVGWSFNVKPLYRKRKKS